MSRRIALLLLIFLIGLAGCVRPDKSPSPFDALAGHGSVESTLPSEPQPGPDFEIIPDSELVYGPALQDFSVADFNSISLPELAAYAEEVDERVLNGSQILEKVSRDYSVNPRLLLALLRYRSAETINLDKPFIKENPDFVGLFRQLSWAANQLNFGYYSRRVGGLARINLADGVQVDISPDVSDATAAMQYVLGLLEGYLQWQAAVGPLGLYADYLAWFGDPQAYAVEPLIPIDLTQPVFHLPFTQGESWFFTSGPHSAWGDGAAWAALDLAPDKPYEGAYGCYESQAWVRAMADGAIVRSADGLVVQDLGSDGFEGTDWSILYMHIATNDRVQFGVYLKAGDPIGHPSCEGGPSDGTHLHLARRYNGEWIPADQNLPFVLDGWVSAGFGVEYDGSLSRDGIEIQASGFPTDENKIYH